MRTSALRRNGKVGAQLLWWLAQETRPRSQLLHCRSLAVQRSTCVNGPQGTHTCVCKDGFEGASGCKCARYSGVWCRAHTSLRPLIAAPTRCCSHGTLGSPGTDGTGCNFVPKVEMVNGNMVFQVRRSTTAVHAGGIRRQRALFFRPQAVSVFLPLSLVLNPATRCCFPPTGRPRPQRPLSARRRRALAVLHDGAPRRAGPHDHGRQRGAVEVRAPATAAK